MRKKWIVIVPTIIAILLTWLLTKDKGFEFTSTAELSTGYVSENSFGTQNNQNNTVLFGNVLQTLQSKRIIDQVSNELLIHDLNNKTPFRNIKNKSAIQHIISQFPDGQSGLNKILQNKIDSFRTLNVENKQDKTIIDLQNLYGYSTDFVLNSVLIFQIDRSDFIRITTTTENPQLSSFISNSICTNFLQFYHTVQQQTSATSIDTLRSIANEKKQQLDVKLMLLNGNPDASSANLNNTLGNLQNQLTQEKSNLIAAQVSLANINKQITQNEKRGGLSNNEDIISLRANIDNLWAKYVNSGSNNNDLLNQINKLRQDLQKKLTEAGEGSLGISINDLLKQKMDLSNKINISNQTIAELQHNINSLNNSAQSFASKQGTFQGIQNEIDVARQEYIDANARYNDALNRNIFPGNNFKQTLVASPPLSPNSSKKLLIVAFAGAGVFFFIIFILLLIEFIDPSIKAPSYLREHISIPLLANIPLLKIADNDVVKRILNNSSSLTTENDFKDRIRQLRYDLKNSGGKIILITSSRPKAGKSTILKSLANTLSLSNNNILIIDANFKHNTLSKERKIETVIEDFKINPATFKTDIKNLIVETDNKSISFIGCRGGDFTPDEVLGENNIFNSLKSLPYDFVLIESAGLIEGPDSNELLKYVDSVIIVMAADQPLNEEETRLISSIKSETYYSATILNKVKRENINL